MLQKNSVVNLVSKSFPVLLIVLVIAFRSVHLLGKPYLWAEDALIFLSRACQSGVSAIGESFAGYYHLLPQGTMLVAVWVSEAVTGELRIVPYISYSFALSWSAAVFAYFALGDFDWLVPGRWRRTCISLLTILLISSSTYEVWFTITNFQWWAEVFIFFAGLNVVHNWEMPKWSVLVMLTLIGYSTPAGGLTLLTVLATCCVRWQRKNFSKTDVLKLCVIALPVAVQLASVLGSDRGGTLLRVGALIQLLLKYFVVILPQNTFPEFTLFGR